MDNTALAVRNSKYSSPFTALLATGFSIFIIRDYGMDLLNPAHFLTRGLVAAGLSAASIFWWLSVFDKRPWLKLGPEGLALRRWIFPFTPMTRLAWGDIEYVYIEDESGKGAASEILCIGVKRRSKELRLNITGFHAPTAQVLSVLYHYSGEYRFPCLGMKAMR